MSVSDSAYHANLRRGQLLRQSGQHQEACKFLGAAIEADPEQPQPYLEIALSQSEMPGKRADSLKSIDRAVALAPNSAHFIGYKAYLLSRFGRHKEALDFASRALAISPTSHIGLLAQTNAHTKLAQWTRAEASARRMLELDAEDTSALNLLSQSLRLQHRFKESREVLSQILARVPEDAFGQTNAGYEALRAGDHRRANEHFLNALRVDPKFEHARRGLVESLRSRVWIYRMNLKILDLAQGGRNFGAGFRLAILALTFVTGGLFLIVITLYAFIALTLKPVSDFFLLLEPMGRHALTPRERRSSLFAGAVGSAFLVLLAFAGLPQLLIGLLIYVALFALCVYIPQWVDAWRARKEERAIKE
jgi:tetratricopeptide (TPR) repeat protein